MGVGSGSSGAAFIHSSAVPARKQTNLAALDTALQSVSGTKKGPAVMALRADRDAVAVFGGCEEVPGLTEAAVGQDHSRLYGFIVELRGDQPHVAVRFGEYLSLNL